MRYHAPEKFGLLVSTMVLIGVLLLSLPAFGKDPFSEIAPGSWIELGLANLNKTPLVDSHLDGPDSGRPLLRFEGAMVIKEIMTNLIRQASTSELRMVPADPTPEEVRAWVSALVADYANVTGYKLSSQDTETLIMLTQEFLTELELLTMYILDPSTGSLADSPVVLRGTATKSWEFVDIDQVNPTEGPDSAPAQALVNIARQYFSSYGQLQPDKGVVQVPTPLLARERLSGTISMQEPRFGGWHRVELNQYSIAEEDGSIRKSSVYALDGEVHVATGLTLGTLWVTDSGVMTIGDSIDSRRWYTQSFSGQYRPRPDLAIVGELSRSVNPTSVTTNEAEAKRLGAILNLGELQLGADIKDVGAGFKPVLENPEYIPDSSGFGFSVKYRNLLVQSEHSSIRARLEDDESQPAQKSTSLSLNYSFADRAVLKAGYQFVDVDSVADETAVDPDEEVIFPTPYEKNEASLGVDFNLNKNTKLEAGIALGWSDNESMVSSFDTKKASAGVLWRLPWEMDMHLRANYEITTDPDSSRSVTKLGLGYNFLDNASLLVGYQLINFGSDSIDGEPVSEEKSKTGLSAELSINF